jgi:A/G-specific adenine glycosylase
LSGWKKSWKTTTVCSGGFSRFRKATEVATTRVIMTLDKEQVTFLQTHCAAAQERLLAWFARHARDLPWRHDRTPYRVWVAEVMLQQTQVEKVREYYDRFMARFPTVESLAAAPLDDVLKQWEGMGYYSRARALHRAAQEVVARYNGQLPADIDALRRLPGIGAYTAGAVASFAFYRRTPLVDTNVARVLTRYFAPRLHPKRARDQKAIWAIAEASLPRTGKATWTHNQALMEIGALVCTARVKKCGECPVRRGCRSSEV